MTKLSAILIMSTIFAFLSTAGCYYDNEEDLFGGIDDCDTTNISYADDVLPILVNRCYACHENGLAGGGILLNNYDNTKIWIDNGRLLGSIKQEPGFSPMPKDAGKIPDCEIDKIEAWVRIGAPDN
jgi:hypothetical protein